MIKIKRGIAIAIAICLCAIPVFLTGCTPSAESLLKDVVNNLDKIESVSAKSNMDVDVSITMYGETVNYKSTLDITTDITTSPDVMHSKGTLSLNLFGAQNDMNIESYFVTDSDGNTVTYEKTFDNTGWRLSDSTLNTKNFVSIVRDLAASDMKMEVTEEKEKDEYLVSGKVPHDILKELIGTALFSNTMISTELANGNYDFSNFEPVVNIYVDKSKKLPTKISIDFTNDFNTLVHSATIDSAELDAQNPNTPDMDVNKFTLNIAFSGYNEIDKIEVPQDVIKNAKPVSEIESEQASQAATASTEKATESAKK